MSCYAVTELYIHPVKSFQALSVTEAQVDSFGFYNDRRFMLVDRSSGKFITQRQYSSLSKLAANFDGQALNISGQALEGEALSFGLSEFVRRTKVIVWSDEVDAYLIEDDFRTKALSEFLGRDVALAYMPDTSFRQVDPNFFPERKAVSFADGFPFLLANMASLNDLNRKLSEPIGIARFRPNIVFNGDVAFQEDEWKRIAIGDVLFEVVKPCSRCVMTGIDENGVKNKEPLATLSTYRKNQYGVCFGQNMVQLNTGIIKVGDKLEVLE